MRRLFHVDPDEIRRRGRSPDDRLHVGKREILVDRKAEMGELKRDVRARTVAAGRDPDAVEATACVYVRVPGGAGRTMGDPSMGNAAPLTGTPEQLAEQLAAFAVVGAAHLQLVVDPITQDSIEWLGQVLSVLDS